MKKIFTLLLLALVLLAPTTLDARTFVLSIGIADYEGDEHDLLRSGQDAMKFSDLMKKQTNDVVTVTSKNATCDNIIAVLQKISGTASEGDRIVLFYSGHGVEDGIVATDLTGISYNDILSILLNSKATDIVCFFDACFSGTAVKSVKSTDKNLVLFLSSRSNETSTEDRNWMRSGYFTQALIKGMRGFADSNHDKQITAIELFKYVYKDVTARVDKTNTLISDESMKKHQHPQLIAAKRCQSMVLMKW